MNLSYFKLAVWNKRHGSGLEALGPGSLRRLCRDRFGLMKGGSAAPYIDTNARIFISKRVGCYVYSQVYGSILNSLCVSG